MYDVMPFITPVKDQPERSIDLVEIETDLMEFRKYRSTCPIADIIREKLGIE